MWRYRPLLPLPGADAASPAVGGRASTVETSYRVGGTPLVEAPRLAAVHGIRALYVKDEGRNPTASLKDRASALVVAAAVRAGTDVVCTASSGNAAAALAGCCAAAGIRCVAFVPLGTPAAKISQLQAYGASVFAVREGYEAAVELSYRAADEFGWWCRSTAYNPLTAEGKKTVALEIAEELGWEAPDVVVVPAGDGNILVGAYRGFADALQMGWIPAMPRLVAVQSEQAPALHRAWLADADEVAGMAATSTAESINVAEPQDGFRALRAVRDTGGAFVAVADEAMKKAVRELAALSGVFAEPAGAAPLAALPFLRAAGAVSGDDTVVLISTGSGLKSQQPIAADPVHVVDGRLDAIREVALAIGAGG